MNSTAKIAIGSKNPVKIAAALLGFQTMFPNSAFTAEGYAADSGVSDQPMSNSETLEGATHRAQALGTLAPDADYHVGIEGGIEVINDMLFANAWIVIIDADGKVASGRSGSFPLPPQVKSLVESGMDFGHANDHVFSEHNSKHAGGAVGSLTGGIITRQSLYEHAMALALVPFRQPDLFDVSRVEN